MGRPAEAFSGPFAGRGYDAFAIGASGYSGLNPVLRVSLRRSRSTEKQRGFPSFQGNEDGGGVAVCLTRRPIDWTFITQETFPE